MSRGRLVTYRDLNVVLGLADFNGDQLINYNGVGIDPCARDTPIFQDTDINKFEVRNSIFNGVCTGDDCYMASSTFLFGYMWLAMNYN